jgi:hypothetical protein
MSKTSSSRLTPPRKNRRQPASTPELFDILDDVHDCCQTIATVAALLEASDDEILRPQAVSDAGTLIADAARELKSLVNTIPKKTQ